MTSPSVIILQAQRVVFIVFMERSGVSLVMGGLLQSTMRQPEGLLAVLPVLGMQWCNTQILSLKYKPFCNTSISMDTHNFKYRCTKANTLAHKTINILLKGMKIIMQHFSVSLCSYSSLQSIARIRASRVL